MGEVHVHLALDEFCLAGGAHTVLAGVGQLHALVETGIEDVFAHGSELKTDGSAVGDEGDAAAAFLTELLLPLPGLFEDGFRVFAGAGEEFVVDLPFTEAGGTETA